MGLGLGNIVLDEGRDADSTAEIADIITFIESDWGLGQTLFPVQKVILKAHYGIPLDDVPEGMDEGQLELLEHHKLLKLAQVENPLIDPTANEKYLIRYILRKHIHVTDFRKHPIPDVAEWMSEAEYLRHLYAEGRSNIAEVIEGQERREMILSVGRRSGKTTISACIAAYETYKLLSKGNPQQFYGLPDGNTIQLISVATDKDQAGLLYRDVAKYFAQCEFFRTYQANATQSFARFQTPSDIERHGRYADNPNASAASINVTFRSCIAKGLRGAGNIVIILDEVAHFTDGGQSSADEVYQAVKPSLAAFTEKNPYNKAEPIGPVEGRMILISSPLGRQGKFYEQFQIAMRGGKASQTMLAIEAPTWEVNPTIPAEFFESEYVKDTNMFFTEYGGKFSDRTLGWIEDARDLLNCVDPNLKPRTRGLPRAPYFIGLDVGLVNDGTAVAIGHIEQEKIVLDYIDQIKAGEGEYANYERLEFEDVSKWIHDLSRKFLIDEGMFDQWAGIPLEQALLKKGLKQIKATHFTQVLNSQVFRNFKDMLFDSRLVLYDYTDEQREKLRDKEGKAPDHMPYLTELLTLQADYRSKYVVNVSAPNIAGAHDDLSDALVRMVWLASQKLSNRAYIAGRGRQTGPNRHRISAGKQRKQILASKKGGSMEQRQLRRVGRQGFMPVRGGRLKG